jgi:drug/metabolite transporter (DMT)-like permease
MPEPTRVATATERQIVLGAAAGVCSAALFGISAPAAKLLLPRVDAWMLAALLYLGAGTGLAFVRILRPGTGRETTGRGLQRSDAPLLIAIAAIGGGLGPVLMLVGLRHLSGVAGSLLLNLEAVFTMLLAVTMFRERLSSLELTAALIVLAGAVLLSVGAGQFRADLLGVLGVSGACLAWGVDNNLTARLSHRNPVDLVRFKALTAGIGNLVLALIAGRSMPTPRTIALSLGVGFVCYGVSIVLDVYALRYIGAAREAAFFATAPFAGAVAAIPMLGERFAPDQTIAGLVMMLGVALLITARRRAGSTA